MALVVDVDFVDEAQLIDINRDLRIEHGLELRHQVIGDAVELGLIYRVDIEDDRTVKVDMTLTTPNCPSAAELPQMVENAVASVPGVAGAKCNVVWEPPWDPSRMSDEARVVLNMW
jgi:metal-sulfur cluster biosynthetic enzyme